MENKRVNDPYKNMKSMVRIIYYIQVALVLLIVLYLGYLYLIKGILPQVSHYSVLILLVIVMMVINGYILNKDSSIFKGLDDKHRTLEASYDNIEQLNRDLRAQRHDFLNHIQVLYSLVELEEYDETAKYLNKLYGDVGKLSANIKTKSVAINALLQAKSNEAEVLDINYTVEINTKLEYLNMPDWELCRVVGNLIDNAFEATAKSRNPFVKISMSENITDYEVQITNSSLLITETLMERLLEAGFTTKKDDGNHGMGLYITNNIMEKYHNEILLSYHDELFQAKLIINKAEDM